MKGWQLGDQDQWAKMTNFEHAVRIPLVISTPGGAQNSRVSQIVESIDIFPTIVEEAMGQGQGQPPPCPAKHIQSRIIDYCSEGQSLSPLLNSTRSLWDHSGNGVRDNGDYTTASYNISNTTSIQHLNWNGSVAYSQFPRPEHPGKLADLECQNQSVSIENCPNKMGYTLRSEKYE